MTVLRKLEVVEGVIRNKNTVTKRKGTSRQLVGSFFSTSGIRHAEV